jgi:adenosylcobinamide-phosphate synthase
MAAMALRLGLRLGKPGVYTLHADGRSATPDDLRAARAVAWHAVVAGAALIATLAWTLRP